MLTIGAKQSGTIKKCYIEALTSVKQVILETLQNSQENTYATVSFLITLQRPATVFKKRLWHRCFPVNFAKYLRTFFLQNSSGLLFLNVAKRRTNSGKILVLYSMEVRNQKLGKITSFPE